jgi:hypothetical protein
VLKKNSGLLAVVILLAAGVIGFYLMQGNTPAEIKPEQPIKAVPVPVAATEPVKPAQLQESVESPLPQLQDSDPIMREALSGLLDGDTFSKYFRMEDIVRHVVVTIDNLPRKTAAVRLFPIKPVGGKFLTAGDEKDMTISPENSVRYAPYVRIAGMVDTKRLVALYTRFSPLFQRAYQELGYPNGSFNDRLITVIDHLLGAPEITGPVRLVQPNVVFLYADPTMEAQSAGRKIMMRMGRENEVQIKRKLREIRGELAGQFAKQLSAK